MWGLSAQLPVQHRVQLNNRLGCWMFAGITCIVMPCEPSLALESIGSSVIVRMHGLTHASSVV